MKSTKRIITVFIALLLVVSLLAGCSESPEKVFSAEGMSITLNEDFSYEELDGATACFRSLTALIIVEKYEFDDLKDEGLDANSSIENFADYIIESYVLDEETKFKTHESGKFIYSEYTAFVQDGDYTFVPCLYKSDDAFWIVNFCSPMLWNEDSEKDFFKWAQTVEFS